MTPLDATPPDLAALLALNNAHAAELCYATPERFAWLTQNAFAAFSLGGAEALLIAFEQDAAYDSPNFLWFKARLPRFVYIDRVVTDAAARGRGHARRLYDALFVQARSADHTSVVCEVNEDPPNPASDAFHARLGFAESGRAVLPNGKTVRYFRRDLP